MDNQIQNLIACARCREYEAGTSLCDHNGKTIHANADEGKCPHPGGSKFTGVTVGVTVKGKVTPPGKKRSYVPADPKTEEDKILVAASKGLGDDIEKLAQAIGADRVAKLFEQVTGWSCGCKWRRNLLNRLIPYKTAA